MIIFLPAPLSSTPVGPVNPAGLGLGWAVALLAGFLAGRWWEIRRGRSLAALDPPRNLDALERARDAAEAANLELSRAVGELELAAGTDRLTGAWNRRRFEEAALSFTSLANRTRDPLSLISFDLDHFKRVNDSFGHAAGDRVLVELVRVVKEHLRASDHLARWGGEEFMVIQLSTGLAGAAVLAEKLREAVATADFGPFGPVTISLGVTEFVPGERIEEWTGRVDKALYEAKGRGRNLSVVLGPTGAPSAPEGEGLLNLHWDLAYECGQATIDGQHRRLFDLANALMACVTESGPAQELSLRLQVLLAHTAQHFHDEEILLEKAGYPALPEHAREHLSLIQKAKAFQADLEAGRLDRVEFLGFLALDLVKGHIIAEDRHYFACLGAASESGGR